MSVRALTLAFAARKLSPAEKLVLLALADFADDQMRCWPSQEKIADITELSARTVWASLKELEARRMLSRVSRKRADGTRSTDVFTLHFAGELSIEPLAIPAKASRNPCETQSQSLQEPIATVATLTTFEPSIEEPREATASGAQAPAKPIKRAAKRVPIDWMPKPAHFAIAAEEGFAPGEIEREIAKFRDHEFRDPKTDWDAAFRRWIRTAAERRPSHERPNQPSAKFLSRQANLERAFARSEDVADRRDLQRARG